MEIEPNLISSKSSERSHELSQYVEKKMQKTYDEFIEINSKNIEDNSDQNESQIKSPNNQTRNSPKNEPVHFPPTENLDQEINEEFVEDNESCKEFIPEETPKPKKTEPVETFHELDSIATENLAPKKQNFIIKKITVQKPFTLNGLVLEKMGKYNGLKDAHLQGFFCSQKRKMILMKNGLISPDGFIINRPEEYLKKIAVYERTNLIERTRNIMGVTSKINNPSKSRPKPSVNPIKKYSNSQNKQKSDLVLMTKYKFNQIKQNPKENQINQFQKENQVNKNPKDNLIKNSQFANRMPVIQESIKSVSRPSLKAITTNNDFCSKIGSQVVKSPVSDFEQAISRPSFQKQERLIELFDDIKSNPHSLADLSPETNQVGNQ